MYAGKKGMDAGEKDGVANRARAARRLLAYQRGIRDQLLALECALLQAGRGLGGSDAGSDACGGGAAGNHAGQIDLVNITSFCNLIFGECWPVILNEADIAARICA